MPIYEYACKSCGGKFEKLVKSMGEQPAIACPDCHSTQTVRALSVFAVGTDGGKSSAAATAPGMCGRCGGPGPCAMD